MKETLLPAHIALRLLLIAWALVLLLPLSGCSPDDPDDVIINLEAPVLEIELTTATTSRLYAGRLQGAAEVDVRARVQGILQERTYSEGSAVEAGQQLFQIDPAQYEVSKQRAAAGVDRAEAEVRQAEREWDRVSGLYEDDAISSRERDEALSELEFARASLSLAQAELAEAEIDLAYTRVEAPAQGTASLEEVPPGSLVQPGDLLTRIVRMDPVEVRFSVPEQDAQRFGGQLRAAQGFHTLLVLSDGEVYDLPGEIDFVDAAVQAETGTVSLRAVFPNPTHRLAPGQFVRVSLDGLHLGNGALVPHRALTQTEAGPAVYVLDEDNRPQLRTVTLASDLGTSFLISEGLDNGDRVLLDGLASVGDNVVVVAQPPDDFRDQIPVAPPPLLQDPGDLPEPLHVEPLLLAEERALRRALISEVPVDAEPRVMPVASLDDAESAPDEDTSDADSGDSDEEPEAPDEEDDTQANQDES